MAAALPQMMIENAIAEFDLGAGCILVVWITGYDVTAMLSSATGPYSSEVAAVDLDGIDLAPAVMRIAHGRGLFRPATAHERMAVLHALHGAVPPTADA